MINVDLSNLRQCAACKTVTVAVWICSRLRSVLLVIIWRKNIRLVQYFAYVVAVEGKSWS